MTTSTRRLASQQASGASLASAIPSAVGLPSLGSGPPPYPPRQDGLDARSDAGGSGGDLLGSPRSSAGGMALRNHPWSATRPWRSTPPERGSRPPGRHRYPPHGPGVPFPNASRSGAARPAAGDGPHHFPSPSRLRQSREFPLFAPAAPASGGTAAERQRQRLARAQAAARAARSGTPRRRTKVPPHRPAAGVVLQMMGYTLVPNDESQDQAG